MSGEIKVEVDNAISHGKKFEIIITDLAMKLIEKVFT